MNSKKLTFSLISAVVLISLAVVVQAAQEIPLSKLALQPQELPAAAKVSRQGEFTANSPIGVGAYGMVDEDRNQLVQGYVRGYTLQASDQTQGMWVVNYIYQFATPELAEAEYARWQQEELAALPEVTRSQAVENKAGMRGLKIAATDSEVGSPIYWLVGVKGRYLFFVVLIHLVIPDPGFSPKVIGPLGAGPQVQAGQQVFNQLADTILTR